MHNQGDVQKTAFIEAHKNRVALMNQVCEGYDYMLKIYHGWMVKLDGIVKLGKAGLPGANVGR